VSGPVALVTGASGFVGSHVVDELLRQGARVRCLLRSTSSRRWLEGKQVENVNGDLCSRQGLDAAVAGADWIVHAAGLTHAPDAAGFHQANVLGTENILAAALNARPAPRRFVYISSQAAAGPSRNGAPVTEALVPAPVSTYGKSKLGGETLVMRAADRLPVVAIRPPTVYGPRDNVLLKYFRTVKHHIRPYLGGAKPFSVVYAQDHARAVWAAVTQEAAVGQIYFVAGPDVTSYEEMGDAITRAMGTWAVPLPIPAVLLEVAALAGEFAGAITRRAPFFSREKFREITAGAWIVSSRKIRDQLGWAPVAPLEESVRATAGWYREAGWV
jgi:nucleoside-diphosphate-sugar epimerase